MAVLHPMHENIVCTAKSIITDKAGSAQLVKRTNLKPVTRTYIRVGSMGQITLCLKMPYLYSKG